MTSNVTFDYLITPMTEPEIPAAADLLHAAFAASPEEPLSKLAQRSPTTRRLFPMLVADRLHRTWLCRDGKALHSASETTGATDIPPLGLLAMDGPDTIEFLYTDPDRRGDGIGCALLDHAASLARTAACPALSVRVVATNMSARAFYEAQKFSPLTEETVNGLNLIVLQKDL